MNNLFEAFKKLDLLEEEVFDVSDDGIEKLKTFLDTEDETDEVEVIDTEAETEEDLEDSYVGKVILDCCVCHTKIYKDKKDVIISEDGELVNVDEECPFCFSTDGYKIVGQVAEFDSDETEDEKETEVEVKETEKIEESCKKSLKENWKTDDIIKDLADRAYLIIKDKASVDTQDDIEEAVKDAIDDGLIYTDDIIALGEHYGVIEDSKVIEDMYDYLFEDVYDEVAKILGPKDESVTNKKCGKRHLKESADKDPESFTINVENGLYIGDLCYALENKVYHEIWGEQSNYKDGAYKDPETGLEFAMVGTAYGDGEYAGDDGNYYPVDAGIIGICDRKLATKYGNMEKYGRIVQDVKGKVTISYDDGDIKVEWPTDAVIIHTEDEEEFDEYDESIKRVDGKEHSKKNFKESIGSDIAKYQKWVDYDMKKYGDISNITKTYLKRAGLDIVKDDHGEYEVIAKSADKDAEKEECLEEDFKDVSITTDKEHMEMTSDENGKVTITTEPVVEEHKEEAEVVAPISDEDIEEIERNSEEENAEETEVQIDDFSEKEFDELGEKYFKKSYNNVDNYKTTKVEKDNNRIKVEGLIKFTSGKQKKTSFILEALDITKSGKARFVGDNCDICAGRKAFVVTGKIDNNRFISESLNYDYNTKDSKTGKKCRVSGTVSIKK